MVGPPSPQVNEVYCLRENADRMYDNIQLPGNAYVQIVCHNLNCVGFTAQIYPGYLYIVDMASFLEKYEPVRLG